MEYQDRHVIITGGSSGIGKSLAREIVIRGGNVSLIARERQKLESAEQELLALKATSSQQIFVVSADVAEQNSIASAISKAIATLGVPEMLITSAGVAHPGYFSEIPLETFEQTMAVNYFGSLYSVKAVLPAMIQQERGRIVLLSSGAGIVGIYGYSAYCPAKFAVRGLAESLRGELKPWGIGVTIAYPPDTDTPQLAAENKTKPAETKHITAKAKVWSAEAVAEKILRGVSQQKFAIAPGAELTVLYRLHSLIAPALHWYFDRIVSQTSNKNKQNLR